MVFILKKCITQFEYMLSFKPQKKTLYMYLRTLLLQAVYPAWVTEVWPYLMWIISQLFINLQTKLVQRFNLMGPLHLSSFSQVLWLNSQSVQNEEAKEKNEEIKLCLLASWNWLKQFTSTSQPGRYLCRKFG